MGDSVVRIVLALIGLTLTETARINVEGAYNLATEKYKNYAIAWPKVTSGQQRVTDTLTQNGEHLNHITVTLQAFSLNLDLDLRLNKDLVPSTYIERHYDSTGRVIVTKPHKAKQKRTHCFYHGSLKFIPGSVVALSTCAGISGFIHDTQETYYVEPLGHNITSRHVVYRESDQRPTNLTCGHKDEEKNSAFLKEIKSVTNSHHRSKRALHGPYDRNSKTRVVELFVSNDHRQYLKYERDKEKIIHRTKSIINIVNSLYIPLNVRIVLIGVEIWTERDRSGIMDDADDTMNNYLEYRKTDISPVVWHDNAQLITGHAFTDGVVGKAVKGVMCTYQYSGGVSMDHAEEVGAVATTMAHEIGHNFGMEHDTGGCHCEEARCIMAPTSGGPNPVYWSSCSVQYLKDAFDQGLDYCLLNWPERTYEGPVCGNSFVEDGEECDCGLPEDCTSRCCDPSTCKLFANATCATGQCCDQDVCQLKPAAAMCRAAQTSCDLPEFCNGQSEWCPADVYLQNGHKCQAAEMQAYCYEGKCQSHASQCQLLWGHTGRNANWQCYKYFNGLGMAAGNCHYEWTNNTYKKCEKQNLLCGLLHCDHANEKLMFWKESLSLTIPENWVMVNSTRHECKGAILDVGLNSRDPGMVPDGASCGVNKMCLRHQCLPIESLGFKSCSKGCNNLGVCNSNGNCHCDVGFAPPYCDSAGNGGSVDSGPVKVLKANVALIIGVCLFFVVILPLLATAAYLMYKNREKLKMYVSVPTQSKPPPPPLPKDRPICKAIPVRSVSSVSTKSAPGVQPARNVQRMSSFRDMEISTPVFQSSTNQTPVNKLSDVNTTDPLVRPASMIVPTAPHEPLVNRPNSVIVQGPCDQKQPNVHVSYLSENDKFTKDKTPVRPPLPKSLHCRNKENISAPIPIHIRPLPALPDEDEKQYYNEDPHNQTESIYYNEDSGDKLDKGTHLADVKVSFKKDPPIPRQPYVNVTTNKQTTGRTNSQARNNDKTTTVPLPQKSKFSGLKNEKKTNNTSAVTKDTQIKSAVNQAGVKLQKTGNPVRTASNATQNPGSTTQKAKSSELNNSKSKSVIPKKGVSFNSTNNSAATGKKPPYATTAGHKQKLTTVPSIPPHKTKPNSSPDSPVQSPSLDEYSSSLSVTKPVGKVAAMRQKFSNENQDQPQNATAVTRSKSSVTQPKQTRPVTRTQTSAGELRTKQETKAGGGETEEKVKPPLPPTKPPPLSRSVSSAGDTNSNADTDTNRKRVVMRTKSSAGDRPKLPVPPKPPGTKGNSSKC